MSRIATTVLGTLLLASHAFSPARQLRPTTRLRATAVADELKALAPAQGAMLVTKWKTGVENDIALGFLPEHTHPDRSVQRSMFVQKAYFRAYNDMRTFATASMAGPEAIAKTLGEDWKGAQVYGILRNSETQAAGVACVQTNEDRFDIVHLLMTPDQRDPDVVAVGVACAHRGLQWGHIDALLDECLRAKMRAGHASLQLRGRHHR